MILNHATNQPITTQQVRDWSWNDTSLSHLLGIEALFDLICRFHLEQSHFWTKVFEFYNSKGLFSHQNIKAMTTVWTREDTNVLTTQFASLSKSAHLCGFTS